MNDDWSSGKIRRRLRSECGRSFSFAVGVKDHLIPCRPIRILAPLLKNGASSSSALTKHLLQTLPDESNPITHSDIYHRTGQYAIQFCHLGYGRGPYFFLDHVVSAATGHQRSDGRGQVNKDYMASRSTKLRNQLPERREGPEGRILQGIRAYINGYLEGTTDIEMKRIVTLAGGQTL